MAKMDTNNYYRLIALLVDVAPKVVCSYFESHILQGSSFKSYLNKNKHLLFHLSSRKKCCQCPTTRNRKTLLSRQQFLLLFQVSVPRCGSENECICQYDGKECVQDLTLVICLLTHCEQIEHSSTVYNLIVRLQEVRNEVLHKSDKRTISSQHFERVWNQMNNVLIGVAGEISNTYIKETRQMMEQLKTKAFSIEDKLKEITFIKEWYLQKSCEIENLQREVNESDKRAKRQEQKFEQFLLRYNKSNECKLAAVTRQLDEIAYKLRSSSRLKECFGCGQKYTSTSKVNDTAKKTIPILLFLEIPKDWDQEQIKLGIEQTQMSLNELSGYLQIRYVLTDQQTMLLDIEKREPYDMLNKIFDLLENIVITSKVDTSTQATLSATLEVVAEEDIPPIPDKSITASFAVNSEELNEDTYPSEKKELSCQRCLKMNKRVLATKYCHDCDEGYCETCNGLFHMKPANIKRGHSIDDLT